MIQEEACTDLSLVDGNPLGNLDLVPDPDERFDPIMEGGVIYENTSR